MTRSSAIALMAAALSACTVKEKNGGSDPDGAGGAAAGGATSSGGAASSGGASSGGASSGGRTAGDGGSGPEVDAGPDADAGPDGALPGPHSVSGTLRVSDLLFVDGDILDPTKAVEVNDSLQDAQPLSSPAMVSGFVGVVPNFPDPDDYFRVALGAGDTATLYIGTPSDGSALPDFDLTLLDGSGATVDESLGTSSVEQVQATVAGAYYLKVSI